MCHADHVVAAGYPDGAKGAQFAASIGFFMLWMGFLCLIYLIAAIRTNVVFVLIFLSLVLAFSFLAGSYWQAAKGNMAMSATLLTGGGSCTFCTCMFGWYIFFVQVLASVDFPINLPVGDLSTVIKGGSERRKTE
jgi:uncharacterized protein